MKNGKLLRTKYAADSKRDWIVIFCVAFILFAVIMLSFNRVEDVVILEEETPVQTDIPIIPPEEDYVPKYTEYQSEESAEYLWNKLSEYSPNDYITAGVLGYFKRESELRSDAVAGWHTTLNVHGEDHCDIFTAAIDEGLPDCSSREQFIHDCKYKYGGYGLGQWSSTQYCEDLYDLAHEKGMSIGDADLQCEFVFQSMQKNEVLWDHLMEVGNPVRAGELIALLYDGSKAAMGYTATMAAYYYRQFALGGFT